MSEHATQMNPAVWSRESFPPLDRKDRQILHLLQESGRLSSAELARRVDLSPAGLQKRLPVPDSRVNLSGILGHLASLIERSH